MSDDVKKKYDMQRKNRSDCRRPKMPVKQRAKQFMPFAAVTGLDDALREKEQEIRLSFDEPDRTKS
jgi:hypothetical protein